MGCSSCRQDIEIEVERFENSRDTIYQVYASCLTSSLHTLGVPVKDQKLLGVSSSSLTPDSCACSNTG